MTERTLPFEIPEKGQNPTPEVTDTNRPPSMGEHTITHQNGSSGTATPPPSIENGDHARAAPDSSVRRTRKASTGSFSEAHESETLPLGSPDVAVSPEKSDQDALMKDMNTESVENDTLSSLVEASTLVAVTEAGSAIAVRVILDGKVYIPSQNTAKKTKLSGLGYDGNQYHCQVCKGFGDVVCCDGCPRVYHRTCIPVEDPSRKSLDSNANPWLCPVCIAGGKNETNVSKRNEKGDRKSSQHKCTDCNMQRLDLTIEPCQECGNYVHFPHCGDGESTDKKVFCSTCKAVNALSREELEAAGLNDPKSDDEDDEEDLSSSAHKKKRKKKHSKKKKKKRKLEEKERARAIMEATGTERTRVEGLPQATPAFYFYLGENRWKVERVLAKKHRTFNRLPKGDERNALVAQEAAVWWSKLRLADQKRYIVMSMKDYEARILLWKDEQNMNEVRVVEEDFVGTTEADLLAEDKRLHQDCHDRLYKSNSVGATPIDPVSEEVGESLFSEVLNDTRFHPAPMMSFGGTDCESSKPKNFPFLDVLGPISTGIGDECIGCTRGWAHFCPVLRCRVPQVTRRSDVQPPLSSLIGTRIGLGLRLPLEHDIDTSIFDSQPGDLFKWRDTEETKRMKRLSVLPSNSLPHPPGRVDDVVNFLEEALHMSIPEPGVTASWDKPDTQVLRHQEAVQGVFRCMGCGDVVDSEKGCLRCRRAQLVVSLSKRHSSSKGRDREKDDERALKVHTEMLGRVDAPSLAEKESEEDKAFAKLLLSDSWTPFAVMPPRTKMIPKDKIVPEDELASDISLPGNEEVKCGEKDDLADKVERPEEKMNAATASNERSVRSSRKQSVAASVDFGDPSERQKIQEQRKRDMDSLSKRLVSIAAKGILVALMRDASSNTAGEGVESGEKAKLSAEDLAELRSSVSSSKYTSLSSFITELKQACKRIPDDAGQLLMKTVQASRDVATQWIQTMKKSYIDSIEEMDAKSRMNPTGTGENQATVPSDPYKNLPSTWPDAVQVLEVEDKLEEAIKVGFTRSIENETAYYGALAIRRAAAAAESVLAPYPESNGIYGVAVKRNSGSDENLRQLVDETASKITTPGGPKSISSSKEKQVIQILRNMQSESIAAKLSSKNGCSRCDPLEFDGNRKQLMAAQRLTIHRQGGVILDDIDGLRIHRSRARLATGLASSQSRDRDQGKSSTNEKIERTLVSVRASRIHGLGLFAGQEFVTGDVVAEYIGELLSNKIAEERQASYVKNKVQSFILRRGGIIIDATSKGGDARYINHSSSPNCITKILPGDDTEDSGHIVFVAQRDIGISEEITVNYQFPRVSEMANRIPCNCPAVECDGFMNWDAPEKAARGVFQALPVEDHDNNGNCEGL